MIQLKTFFKRETLSSQGSRLSKIITKKLVDSEEECCVDFDGILSVSPLFFQQFIFPLIIEFGSHTIDNRLRLLNLNHEHLSTYKKALDQTSAYMDNLASRQPLVFGDISDLTLELLIKARELSRNDPSAAQVVFGINRDMVGFFSTLDIDMIRRIANTGIICFEPRFSPEFAKRSAELDASEIDVFLNVIGSLENIYGAKYA